MESFASPADAAPALSRGLSILESVAAAERELGFAEIAAGLGLPNASVSRLLGVLCAHGYLVRADGKRGGYRPGPRLACLSRQGSLADRLKEQASPLLGRLRDETGNTAAVILWTGKDMVWLTKRVHPAAAPMLDEGSVNADLDEFPWGWLFLLEVTDEARRQLLAQAKERPRRTRLRQAEADLGRLGHVIDNQAVMPHLCRLAAPVRDGRGRLVAALALAGNPLTLPTRSIPDYGRRLVAAAHELSTALY
jgi:DNA-binding IclR family transcriptional regulator